MKKIHLNRALAAKKKKLTILFALLCASVMGFATTYCHSEQVDQKGNHYFITIKKVKDNTYSVIVEGSSTATITGTYNVNCGMSGGIDMTNGTWKFDNSGYGKLTRTFEYASTPGVVGANDLTMQKSTATGAGDLLYAKLPTDADWNATCSGDPDPDPDPDPTPSVSPYCEYEVGHFGSPSADVNSFILLSIGSDGHGHTIVNIKQDANKNSNTFDYINVVGIKDIGSDVTTGGKTEMAIVFNTPTPDDDGNIKFTLQWSNVGDGGRWQLNDITVPANAICENADPFPGEHTYCKYSDKDLKKNNTYAALTWETNAAGDVVITLSDGEGASGTHFRNVGFEFDGNYDKSWKVYSGTKHSVCEPASIYFNYEEAVAGGNTYALRKKNDVTLPSDAVVAFFGHAFSWRTDQDPNAYTFDKWFGYTYGAACPFLAAPTNVAIDGTNHITFDAVTNAQTYTASVYLNGIVKHRQVVNNGDELTFQPYTTGTYQVEVVADAEGYPTSDPSDAYDWELTAPAIVVGNSEYCEWALPKHNNQDANLTWETGDDGAITITLSPLSEQTAVFRAEGMKLSDFTVGAARTAASAYFNRSYTAGGTTVVLTLKDANIAPGLGEKIYFSGYIECKVQDQDTWPNPSLEYTYGSKCSGQKHVTVSVNNNEMGSATVNGVADIYVDEGTQVACVAVPASGYEFVNWTKGGVEVSTELTYTPTINTATDLVANFDYARTTYCHQAVTTNGGKKLYLTVGKGATEGTYQIKIYGSDELTITGINNANTAVNHIKYLTYDGNDVPLTIANGGWSFEATGYGVISSAEIQPQTNHTWRDIRMWRPDLYIGTSAGEQNINAVLNQQNHFNWDNECSDTEAPVIVKAEAEVLNESSVRLKIQATDNWGGLLTYTITREGAEPIIIKGASGEELTQEVTGLTAGTKYTFTVTVSDGVKNANQNIAVTPVADNIKPEMTSASLESKTWNSAIIKVAAKDNKGVTAYYVVEKDADYIATDGKITLEGLTAATDYKLHIKAKDAAGNISDNQAEVSFKTDAHLLAPNAAATAPEWPTDQVKAIYSPTYSANCGLGEWGSGTTVVDDTYGKKYTVGPNGGDGGYFGMVDFTLNCLMMEKLHFDIWVADDMSVRFVPIWDGAEQGITKNLTGQVWNSIDIDLREYTGITNWSKITQMKLDHLTKNVAIWVANAYFYRETAYVDDEDPTSVSASTVAEGFYSVQISAQAKDNSGAVRFKVKNGDEVVANGAAPSAVATTITINNLNPGVNYNFSVLAFDEAGNEAAPVPVAAQTKALPAPAPTPNLSNKKVVPVFTDAMAGGKTDIHSGGWGETTTAQWLDIAANDKVFYVQNFNYAGWHSWGADIDATGMQYLHVDVYSLGATSVQVTPISHDPTHEGSSTIALTPNTWTSYDVPLSNYDAANIEWNKIFQFKFLNPVGGNELMIDNVYFWSNPKYTRNDSWMAPGELGTVCYPEGLMVTGATMYQMAGTDANGKFVFDEVDVLQPGVPYLFEATANTIQFYATPATPATEAGKSNGMVGTFSEKIIPQNSPNIYYFSGKKFYAVTARQTDLTVPANRAYVDLTTPQPATAPKPGVRRITFDVEGTNTTTGVDQLNASDAPAKTIINGHLFILRGDKMYDATGRMVK